jgi:hypothetical protein
MSINCRHVIVLGSCRQGHTRPFSFYPSTQRAMASRMQNAFIRAPERLFGKPREARQPGTPLQVTRDTSIWEIYNHEAEIVDRERIKDWNDSLNTLLIFVSIHLGPIELAALTLNSQAALYSAVLTPFIMQSMSLLQEDNTDTTRQILLVITRQLANSSTPAFVPSTFEAPGWAVRINYFFFVSISCSLITALAAVLALQWVGSYDRAHNQSSPEDRAFQRQFRNEGVQKWGMEQIIAFLPAVIFFALFIFFIGLADWLWHIHHGVAAVAIVGVIIGASFFWVTTLISIVDVGAPFRTPTSRSLPAYIGLLYQKITSVFALFSRNRVISLVQASRKKITKSNAALAKWYRKQRRRPKTVSFRKAIKPIAGLKSLPRRWFSSWSNSGIRRAFKYLLAPLVCQDAFETREHTAINSVDTIRRNTLLWLAQSISVVPHQRNALLILIQALLELPPRQLINDQVNKAPWKAIFSIICEPYFGKDDRDEYSKEEMEAVSFLLHGLAFIGHGSCNGPKFQSLYGAFYHGDGDLFRFYANLAWWRHLDEWIYLRDMYARESLEYAIRYAFRWPHETIFSTLLCLKADLRPLQFDPDAVCSVVSKAIPVGINTLSFYPVLPLPVMDIILEIVADTLSPKSRQYHDPASAYVAAVRQWTKTNPNPDEMHAVVFQQSCAALRQLSGTEDQMNAQARQLLSRLIILCSSSLLKDAVSSMRSHLLLAMAYTRADVWNSEMRPQAAKLLAHSMPNWPDGGDGSIEEWWINILVGFEEVLQEDGVNSHFVRTALVLNIERAWGNRKPDPKKFTDIQRERLGIIHQPHVRLMASWVLESPELALSLLPLDTRLSEDSVWHDLVTLYCRILRRIFTQPHIGLLRELLLTGPPELLGTIFYQLDKTLEVGDLCATSVCTNHFGRHLQIAWNFFVPQSSIESFNLASSVTSSRL